MVDTTVTTEKEPWEDRFLELLERDANVTRAAKGARVSRMTVYRYRDARPSFAKRWAEAEKLGGEALEDECRRRGFEGSDTLLIFLTKAHKPEKYREETLTPRRFVALFEQMLEILRTEVGESDARRVARRFEREVIGNLGNGQGQPAVDRSRGDGTG
jgi:hypothetical protein